MRRFCYINRMIVILILIGSTAACSPKDTETEFDSLIRELWQRFEDADFDDHTVAVAQKAIEVAENIKGPDHPDVIKALFYLSETYKHQEQYAKIEPLYKRVLVIRERTLGPDHPDVANALSNLAVCYHRLNRPAQAEPLFKRALTIMENASGPDHPDVAPALNNLALNYDFQGDYAQAEKMYKRALAIEENALGPEHPDLYTVLSNLAALYTEVPGINKSQNCNFSINNGSNRNWYSS
jgi:tetratricopeptide (TPR) repeat protein